MVSWLGWNSGEWLEEEDQLLFSMHEGMGSYYSSLYW